jgi:TusA-related sulfurtransferase
MRDKIDITLDTKIYDLLKAYPFMEDKLIEINPRFKKLKNPILKRTVAKIASIKQAALVGGMDEVELLNKIREAVGLDKLEIEREEKKESKEDIPSWVRDEPKAIFNANELLDREENPLAYANKILKGLKEGETLLIESDFKPQPLIDEFLKKGYEVYSKNIDSNTFLTYIKR